MTTARLLPPPLDGTLDLDPLLKRLHLANTRRVWRDVLGRAEREAWTYGHLLTLLVTEEIAQRQQTRLGRVVRRAGFPFLKTIDDFNFTYQSTLRLALLGSALSPVENDAPNRKSFQILVNCQITVTMMIGVEFGTMMRQKIWKKRAPSIMAAFTSSSGNWM